MFDTGTDPERNHASGARQKRAGLLEVEVQLATQVTCNIHARSSRRRQQIRIMSKTKTKVVPERSILLGIECRG